MVDSVSNNPQDPSNKAEYKHEFRESVTLFKEALNKYHTSDEIAQKKALEDVMNKALDTMGESASGLMNKHLQQLKSGLSEDLEDYTESPSEEGYSKLQNDIQHIQDNVR